MSAGRAAMAAVCAATAGAVWLSAQSSAPATARIRGFSAAASAAETARETTLRAMPSATAAEADFDVMTAEPHHTESPYEIKLADYVSDQFKQIGIESTKYEYSVLLPWPKQRRIDIVAPDQVRLEVHVRRSDELEDVEHGGLGPHAGRPGPAGVTGRERVSQEGLARDDVL